MKRKLLLCVFVISSLTFAQTHYFPPQGFCRVGEMEDCDRWYVPHLRAMREPSLWELSKEQTGETYRFLWLRTFNHPVSARLRVASDGSGELVVKVLSGSGGYKPGHLILNKTIKIEKESVDHFLGLLNKADFWDSPTEQEQGVGCDGAQWVIEAAKSGRYHAVDRWSPEEGTFRKAALFLAINLGGLNPRYDDVY